MSRQDSTKIEDVKVMLLKGDKGDKGDGSYDDTELRTAIETEVVERGRADVTLQLEIDTLDENKASKTELASETTERENADANLESTKADKTALASEASTRASADSYSLDCKSL